MRRNETDSEHGISNDGRQSRFADLLAEIRSDDPKKDSGESDQSRPERVDELTDDEPVDPLELVREIIAKRLEPSSIEQKQTGDQSGTTNHKKLYAGVFFGIILVLAVPGIVLMTESTFKQGLFSPDPATSVGTNETLTLGADDAGYMSRVFSESTHEVAYCGVITRVDGRAMLEVSLANTIESGPEGVSFNTENCPADRQVLLHTHPNGDSRLSEQDRETIATRPESIICVQTGPITASAGQEAENLVCYKQLSSADSALQLERIRVVID